MSICWRSNGAAWWPGGRAESRPIRAAGTFSIPTSAAWETSRPAPTSPSAGAARVPGSAGPRTPRWKRCARPGSMRRTSPPSRRSATTCSCSSGRTPYTYHSGCTISRPRSIPICRMCPMRSESQNFRPFPHDWQSADYVSGWIEHDVARDPERRPLLRQMLSSAPFARDCRVQVLDVGAGYGVVAEEVLRAFPAARVTLQDYSRPMLDQARRRLADHSDQLSYVLCDLFDPSWPRHVGTSFDLEVYAIALHNLGSADKIFACYRAIHDLLKPGGCFLNYDRFVEGVDSHLAEL